MFDVRDSRDMPLPHQDSSLPEWALRQAEASLKIGHSVPEIEHGLVSKGLLLPQATEVVTAVLEGRVRNTHVLLKRAEWSRIVHRLASAATACLCFGLAYAFGGVESAARTLWWLPLLLGLLLLLACIWSAEVVEQSAPPELIRWVAWLLLILITGYRALILLL